MTMAADLSKIISLTLSHNNITNYSQNISNSNDTVELAAECEASTGSYVWLLSGLPVCDDSSPVVRTLSSLYSLPDIIC